MQSAGNDIVDLELIDPVRSKQSRFYSKILAPAELELYKPLADALPFEFYVWLCWSVKEATYKYSKRLCPQLLFSPTRTILGDLSINHLSDQETIYHGKCANGYIDLHFQSTQTADYIHSIVNAQSDFKDLHSAIFDVDTDNASAQTHHELLTLAALMYPTAQLKLTKDDNNIPTLVVDDKPCPVSISHHGQYGGFAVDLPFSNTGYK